MRFRFCGFDFCFDWVWSKCSYVCINMSCVLILYFQCIFDHSPCSKNINTSGPEIFNLNVVPFLEIQFMWVVCLCFVLFRFVSSFLLRSAKLYFVPHCYGLGSVQSVSALDRLCLIVFFVCAIPVWLLPNPNQILPPFVITSYAPWVITGYAPLDITGYAHLVISSNECHFGRHRLCPFGHHWLCRLGCLWLCPFGHHWLCPFGHFSNAPLVISVMPFWSFQ